MNFVKKSVRDLAAYHLTPHACRVKVNQNENPYDVPEDLKREVLQRLASVPWCRYPPFVPSDLHEALAAHYGVPADCVLAGNGSNEVLYATLAVCVEKGDRVLIPVPTFTLYALLTQVFSAEPVTMPLEADFSLDPDAVVARARETQARVICLCSPNNPTGRQIPRDAVLHIVKNTPALVMLDEAYVEFAPQCLTTLALEHENLAVFRTFSKAMAFAGLRMGAMVARPPLVTEVAKGKLPYAINIFSTLAAIVACERASTLQGPITQLRADRHRLAEGLAAIPGVHPTPSDANFILCRLDRPVPPVMDSMRQAGILIRDVSSYPALAGHVRVGVGTTEEVDQTLAALAVAMK